MRALVPFLAFVAGCGGEPELPRVAPPRASAAPPSLSASALSEPLPEPAPTSSAVASAPAPDVAFPPAAVKAPYERTAKPEDGVWKALDEKLPEAFVTTLHPHKIKPQATVKVVAMDLRRVELHLVAGTLEPKSTTMPKEKRTGLIAEADLPSLLVAFNGGFMAKHGAFGMMIKPDTLLPPRDESCTIALLEGGGVRVATFTALAKVPMVAYRQTPPCLVEDGALHGDLDSTYGAKKWGGSETGEREIRRSGLGLDASGSILFYASGEWVDAKALAIAMEAAGVKHAAELDINWSYTRFLIYGVGVAGPLFLGALMPKTKFATDTYTFKAAERDFFYVTRKR